MSSLTIALIAFACMSGGTLVGALLRRALPGHHLSADSRDVVKLGAGLMATQAALVLGLLVSSAKGTYDTVNSGLVQGSAKIILLNHVLDRYGPESKDARGHLRDALTSAFEQIWPEKGTGKGGISAVEAATGWETVSDDLRNLAPQTDSQRLLKAQALQIAGELSQLRWVLLEQAHGSIPTAFLVVMIFWFTVLFATFGLLTPSNSTVITVMLVGALSIAGGLFLNLEMSYPLEGFIKVSGAPFQEAIKYLGH